MALYAFDGTWNSDEDKLVEQTNVIRFAELYVGNNTEYVSGVGTRFGKLGHVLGGLFGSGGHTRIKEMYDELCDNWEQGDHIIDIIGFSLINETNGYDTGDHVLKSLGDFLTSMYSHSYKVYHFNNDLFALVSNKEHLENIQHNIENIKDDIRC